MPITELGSTVLKSIVAGHCSSSPPLPLPTAMPLVKIDLIKGRKPEEIRALADTVQSVMLEHFNAPYRDRYQVLNPAFPVLQGAY